MHISVSALTILVWIALLVSCIAPIALLTLFVRDRKGGTVW